MQCVDFFTLLAGQKLYLDCAHGAHWNLDPAVHRDRYLLATAVTQMLMLALMVLVTRMDGLDGSYAAKRKLTRTR